MLIPTVMVDKEINNAIKYTSFAGLFDGHGNAPVQFSAYCLTEEVQGYAINQ
jgi:hypothetical protein